MKKGIHLACLIDDDPVYVNLIKKIIRKRGLCDELIVFSNGQIALDYFRNRFAEAKADLIPELIFLDINMPIMDGWDFLENFIEIKNTFGKKIVLYVVSSSINPVDLERAKSYELVSDYLIKPITFSELENIFRRNSA